MIVGTAYKVLEDDCKLTRVTSISAYRGSSEKLESIEGVRIRADQRLMYYSLYGQCGLIATLIELQELS